jgi:hypothetical protein
MSKSFGEKLKYGGEANQAGDGNRDARTNGQCQRRHKRERSAEAHEAAEESADHGRADNKNDRCEIERRAGNLDHDTARPGECGQTWRMGIRR